MRNRDQIMAEWDAIRTTIADGCTNSGPRDWFDGVLDEQTARIAELERVVAAAARAVEYHRTGYDLAASYNADVMLQLLDDLGEALDATNR